MKLTGAEILCETLTRLGVKHIFGYPAAQFFLSTTRSENPSCITFLYAMNRAPHTWPMVMRAPRAALELPWPPPVPAQPIWLPASPPRCSILHRLCASPVRSAANFLAPTLFRKSTSPALPCRSPSST